MSEKRTSAKGSQPVSIGKFLDYEFPEGPPVIESGILPAGGGLILAGPSGVGKSLMRQEIAILLAIGNPVYGLKTPTAQRSIIFQMENTPKMEQARTKRLMAGLGIESLPDHIFYAQPSPSKQRSLKNVEFLRHARHQIEQAKATLFILDPLSSFHNEPENDNIRMRSVLDRATSLSRETGAAALIIHHFGKPDPRNPQSIYYMMRGAQAIYDWCDTAITLTHIRDNPGNVKRDLRQMDFIKIRNGRARSPITLERNNFFVHSMTFPTGKATPQLVFEIIKKHGSQVKSKNDLCKLIIGRVDCAKRTAQKAINDALEHGYIVQKISEKGTRFIPAY